MEKAVGQLADDLRRDIGRETQANVARTPGACVGPEFRVPDLRAIVECLFAAQYSECEIVEYLTGPLGCSDEAAAAALIAARG
jgi:hypothetical protein